MAQVKQYALPIRDIKGVSAARVQVMCGPLYVTGVEMPAILAKIRMNARGIRSFVRFCQETGTHIRECVPGVPAIIPSVEYLTSAVREHASATFEVIGNLEALEWLVTRPCIVSWGYIEVTACSVDCRASGASKKK